MPDVWDDAFIYIYCFYGIKNWSIFCNSYIVSEDNTFIFELSKLKKISNVYNNISESLIIVYYSTTGGLSPFFKIGATRALESEICLQKFKRLKKTGLMNFYACLFQYVCIKRFYILCISFYIKFNYVSI